MDYSNLFQYFLLMRYGPYSWSCGKIEAGFWVMLFHGPRLLLCGPYYTVTMIVDGSSQRA